MNDAGDGLKCASENTLAKFKMHRINFYYKLILENIVTFLLKTESWLT